MNNDVKGILNFGPWVVEVEVGEKWEILLHWHQEDGSEDLISLVLDPDSYTVTFTMPDGTELTGTLS